MKRKNWNTLVPRSPREAVEACVEVARVRRNRSVEQLAVDHMAQASHHVLYKWMTNGRLPLSLILPLEHACGYPLVTKYLAAAHGKLLIDIPTGRAATPVDVQRLQSLLHTATGALMEFYGGSQTAAETLEAIRAALEGLSWHHGNVNQHMTPQLELAPGDD